MLLSGSAACIGEALTIPFDTAKVRLQLQSGTSDKAYRGVIDCLKRIVVEEGARAPFKGLSAGLLRQCAFAPIRIGLYEPVRNFYGGEDAKNHPPSIFLKIAAGLTTSAIGITVASPTDVVKVRFQAEARLPPGATRLGPVVCACKLPLCCLQTVQRCD